MMFLEQYFSHFNGHMNQLGSCSNADASFVSPGVACDSVLFTGSQMMTMQNFREVKKIKVSQLHIKRSMFSRDVCGGE